MKQKAWKSTEPGLGNSPWHRLGDSSHKQCESRCEIPQVQAYSNPISYVKQTSSINYWVNLARKTQLSVHNSTQSSLGAIYFEARKQLYICQKAEAHATLRVARQGHCSGQGRQADRHIGTCSVQTVLLPSEHGNHSCNFASEAEGVMSRESRGHSTDLKQTKLKWNVVSSIPSWVSSD